MSSPSPAPKISFWAWAAIPVLIAAWLRFRGLAGPEPFVDEGGNIFSALDLRAREVLDPVGEGRPALLFLFSPAGWFPDHIVTVARAMTAAGGLLTALALGGLLLRLAGRTAALVAIWLWALLPLAVFHERLALQDPIIAALLAWAAMLLATGCQRESRGTRFWFLGAGFLFGTAVLCKISAVFALPWLGLLYGGIRLEQRRPILDPRLLLIAAGAAAPLLCLGTDLPALGAHSDRFGSLPVFTAPNYWSEAGLRLLRWCQWYQGYGGWPLGLLVTGALVATARARLRPAAGMLLGSLLSLALASLLYHRPFARYLVPDHLPLVIFIAWAAGRAWSEAGWRKILAPLCLVVALLGWLRTSWQIGTDPRLASVPADEIRQYYTGPWSGRGTNQIRQYLEAQGREHGGTCVIVTHRFQRPGCYALLFEERRNRGIGVLPRTIYEPEELALVRSALAKTGPAQIFLLYEGTLFPAPTWLDQPGSPAHLAYEIDRGPGENFRLYRVGP